jgi:hypothetical protein
MPPEWISFELQRRVDHQFNDVRRAVTSPAVLGTGMTMPLGRAGLAVLQAPLRPASFPYEPALHAPATLTSIRGRRVALVRLEITTWSEHETAISLRPLSSRPDRWSPRRVQQYFGLAHACADLVARLIAEETAARSVSDIPIESDRLATRHRPHLGAGTA